MAADQVAPGVYVGVDSGGTRTNVHVREVDAGGRATEASYEVAETLSGALPPELVPSALRTILAPLEAHVSGGGDEGPVHVWVSAAGFTSWTREQYLLAAREVAPQVVGGRIRSIGAANDAVSLLLGSQAHGIVIAGTGSSVIVKTESGDLRQAGGHEWVACDYGSGFWIGLRSIREAYRDFEDGRDSVLLQRLRQIYAIETGDDQGLIARLRGLAIGDKDMKKDIARFAASVCAAAERGDKPAQNIVKAEAEELADVMAGTLRRGFSAASLAGGLKIVQCGSLLGNSFYRTSFETQLEMRLLSGTDQKAHLDWHRVITGADSAIQLAHDLAVDPHRFLGLDVAFRPAVVQH